MSLRVCVVFPALGMRTELDRQGTEQHPAIGAKRACNQAVRGECMARTLGMFCGMWMEGIPQVVVEALLRP